MANTFELIELVTTASTASTVTLGSGGTIPQTYTDLYIVASPQIGTSDGATYFSVRMNASTSNTAGSYLLANGNAGSVSGSNFGIFLYAGSTNQVGFGNGNWLYIANYTRTNYYKSAISNYLYKKNDSSTGQYVGFSTNTWESNAAITSITFNPSNSGVIQAGSKFYLYGIKNS